MKINLKSFLSISLFTIFFASVMLLTSCNGKDEPKDFTPAEGNYLKESTKLAVNIEDYNTIPNNPIPALSVPTYITKIDGYYFIVDCYNNQVIYNDNLDVPVYEWFIMTTDIDKGHTVASDGKVYLIDDTENNRILVMEKTKNLNNMDVFVPTQEFTEIGTRPHYIIYDERTASFYAWSSMTGEMYIFQRDSASTDVYLTKIMAIPELNGFYVRSFTIMDESILFVSGNSNIIECDKNTFEIKNRYPVPPEIAGMVQVVKIDDYYYITVSTDLYGSQDNATMIRTKSLNDLISYKYEDVYDNFIGGGTPYCITRIDEKYYLCEHRLPGHSIWSFDVKDNEIANVTAIY